MNLLKEKNVPLWVCENCGGSGGSVSTEEPETAFKWPTTSGKENLILYYPLDSGIGGVIPEVINEYNGYIIGGYNAQNSTAYAVLNNAAGMANGDVIKVERIPSFEGKNFAISFFVRPASSASDRPYVSAYKNENVVIEILQNGDYDDNGTSRDRFEVRATDANGVLQSWTHSEELSQFEKHNIIVNFHNGSCTIWINGVYIGFIDAEIKADDFNRLIFGNNDAIDQGSTTIYLDEIKFYGDSLSVSDIDFISNEFNT